jgi:preprotein translocase subunit SecE
MVIVMVTLAALFFLAADQILGWFVHKLLGLGR